MELNVIYNEDCISGMDKIKEKSVDAIISDLPYGITKCEWDSVIPLNKLWEQYKRILKPTGNVVLFSSNMFTFQLINSNIDMFRYRMIWKKNVPTGMCSAKTRPMKYFEEICVFNYGKGAIYNPQMKPRVGKHKECYRYTHYCSDNNHINLEKIPKRYNPDMVQPSDVLEFNVVPNRNGKLHPTQKPIELMKYLIKTYSNKGDLILDSTFGSGSTIVAAISEDRNYIGFEINKEYFNTTINRIKEYYETNI